MKDIFTSYSVLAEEQYIKYLYSSKHICSNKFNIFRTNVFTFKSSGVYGVKLTSHRSFCKVIPIDPGLGIISTPAADKDFIFSSALPADPVIMAPACPILLPGGAL